MKGLVYDGPSEKKRFNVPKSGIKITTDAVVKVLKATICATDLHILKGDVPAVTKGRILGRLIDAIQAEYVRIPHADNRSVPDT